MQDRINAIKDYFLKFEMVKDGFVVGVKYPSKWITVPSSNEDEIKIIPGDKPSTYFYYAKGDKVSIDEIFTLIEVTIEANIDMIKKMELLKETINKLKEEFKNREYKDLLKMKISFPKRKGMNKDISVEPPTPIIEEKVEDKKEETIIEKKDEPREIKEVFAEVRHDTPKVEQTDKYDDDLYPNEEDFEIKGEIKEPTVNTTYYTAFNNDDYPNEEDFEVKA